MSTVLWSNSLKNGEVSSDQENLHALYKHIEKLDAVCKKIGIQTISSICDNTNYLINLKLLEMPDSFENSEQLMVKQGIWVEAVEAKEILEKLLNHIELYKLRFGLFNNAHGDIVEELRTSSQFAHNAAKTGAKFNFAIVM